ncbi:MAG: hypothetical protein Kow00127_12310 [Bacteroidales bacterium]
MHEIEPHYNWRHYYIAEEDDRSPFYGREYSEFEFSHAVYNYVIHPQWDYFGSNTLYVKILFTDYHEEFTVLELLGEWNDCLYNDIMYLRREVIDPLISEGIKKFILIGENVLNFHFSENDYYQEWFDEIGVKGWIVLINFRDHVIQEFISGSLDYYLAMGEGLNRVDWRTLTPKTFFQSVNRIMSRRLPA